MKIKLSDHFTYSKLIRFTLPSVAMMIFSSIYGVVDGFFVSNFAGKTPFAAVNLIMPFLMILGTVGFMIGTGGSALVAKTLGEGNREKANRYFSLLVLTGLVLGVVFGVLGIVFLRPVSVLLGARGEILEHCVVYGRIILIALPCFVLQMLFQSFFVAAEKPKLGLCVTLCSGVMNMLLDAVLVILFPEELKLTAAALATAISQLVGALLPILYFFSNNSSLLRFCPTEFDIKALVKTFTNGSSEFMANISMSLVGILYNVQLLRFSGEDGVAAYGVMMYVSMIFSSVFIGYSIGSAPVVSFHYGAGNQGELKSLLKKSTAMILICSVGMTILAQISAGMLSQIFVGYDAKLFSLTLSGFRIFAFCFLFMGMAIFTSGVFTALNDGMTSALVSFLRTLVFQLAAILILPELFAVDGVWSSVVVAELMAAALSVLFLFIKRNKYKYL